MVCFGCLRSHLDRGWLRWQNERYWSAALRLKREIASCGNSVKKKKLEIQWRTVKLNLGRRDCGWQKPVVFKIQLEKNEALRQIDVFALFALCCGCRGRCGAWECRGYKRRCDCVDCGVFNGGARGASTPPRCWIGKKVIKVICMRNCALVALRFTTYAYYNYINAIILKFWLLLLS
jgi:hypothetical protein